MFDWIKEVHKDEKGQYSSMRLAGTTCLMVALVLTCVALWTFKGNKDFATFVWGIGFNFLATSGTLYGGGQVRGIVANWKANTTTAIPVTTTTPTSNPDSMPKA